MRCQLVRACHFTMLSIHACTQGPCFLKIILEARIERECAYTCLECYGRKTRTINLRSIKVLFHKVNGHSLQALVKHKLSNLAHIQVEWEEGVDNESQRHCIPLASSSLYGCGSLYGGLWSWISYCKLPWRENLKCPTFQRVLQIELSFNSSWLLGVGCFAYNTFHVHEDFGACLDALWRF